MGKLNESKTPKCLGNEFILQNLKIRIERVLNFAKTGNLDH